MNLITSILSFIVAIGVLVVVHEMGHFSVARLMGVKVLRFSIGFGKPIFQRVAKNGTEWSIGWLPLGGYVKMLDEREFGDADGAATAATAGKAVANAAPAIDPAELRYAFNRQSVGKRFAIVAAGPVANFLLAIVLFAALYMTGVQEPAAVLGTPPDASAAAIAGIGNGERVVALRRQSNGETIAVRSFPDLQHTLREIAGSESKVTLIAQQDGGRYEHELDLRRASAKFDNGPEPDLATELGLGLGGGAPQVASLEPGSPAAKAGLQTGDVIRQIDGKPVADARAVVEQMRRLAGKTVRLSIERRGGSAGVSATPSASTPTATPDSQSVTRNAAQAASPSITRTIDVTPASVVDPDSGKTIGRIGAGLGSPVAMVAMHYGPVDAVAQGAQRTWDIAAFSVKMFGRMLTGEASLKNLSGPVTIADYAGRSARMGLDAFISFMALVSISLGVLNLLPIPVLDGGHLLYYAVEAVTGRALSDRWQSLMQRAGLLCIVALSVVALFNDLTRLIHL